MSQQAQQTQHHRQQQQRIVKKIACAKDNTFLLLQTGELFTWHNGHAELVDPFGVYFATHSWVPALRRHKFNTHRHNVVDIVCGIDHFVALTDEGLWNLYTWGDNSKGQLGLDPVSAASIRYQLTPRRLVNAEFRSAFVEVQCGDFFTVARNDDGVYFYWGEKELVNGTAGLSAAPVGAPVAKGGSVPKAAHVAQVATPKHDAPESVEADLEVGDQKTLSKVLGDVQQQLSGRRLGGGRQAARKLLAGLPTKGTGVQLPRVLTPRLLPDARVHFARLYVAYFRQHYRRVDTFHHVARAFELILSNQLQFKDYSPAPEFIRRTACQRHAPAILVGANSQFGGSLSNVGGDEVFPVFLPPSAVQRQYSRTGRPSSAGATVEDVRRYVSAILFFTNRFQSLVPTHMVQLFLPSDANLDEVRLPAGTDIDGKSVLELLKDMQATDNGSADKDRNDHEQPVVEYDVALSATTADLVRQNSSAGQRSTPQTTSPFRLDINVPVEEMWDRIDEYLQRALASLQRHRQHRHQSLRGVDSIGKESAPFVEKPPFSSAFKADRSGEFAGFDAVPLDSTIVVKPSQRKQLTMYASIHNHPTTFLDFQCSSGQAGFVEDRPGSNMETGVGVLAGSEPPLLRVVQPTVRVACAGDTIFSYPDYTPILDAKLQAARDRVVLQLQHEHNQISSRLELLRRTGARDSDTGVGGDSNMLPGQMELVSSETAEIAERFPAFARQGVVLLILRKKCQEALFRAEAAERELMALKVDEAAFNTTIRELKDETDRLVHLVLGPATDHQRWARDTIARMHAQERRHAAADSDAASQRLLQRIGGALLRAGYAFSSDIADLAARAGAQNGAAVSNFGGTHSESSTSSKSERGAARHVPGDSNRAAALAARGGLLGKLVALRAEHEALDVRRTRRCRWCARALDGDARLRKGDRVRLYIPLGVPFFNGGYPTDTGLRNAWANSESKLWKALRFLTEHLGVSIQEIREAMIKNSAIGLAYPSDVPSILDAMLRGSGKYLSVNVAAKRLQMYSHIGHLEGASSDEIVTILTAQSTSPDMVAFTDAAGRTRTAKVPYTTEEATILAVNEVRSLKEKGLTAQRYRLQVTRTKHRRSGEGSHSGVRSQKTHVYESIPQQHLELVNPMVTEDQQRHAALVDAEAELAEALHQVSSLRCARIAKERLMRVLGLRMRLCRVRQINLQSKAQLLRRLVASYSRRALQQLRMGRQQWMQGILAHTSVMWRKVLATDVEGSLLHNKSLCDRLRVIVSQPDNPRADHGRNSSTTEDGASPLPSNAKQGDLAPHEPVQSELLHLLYKYSNAVLRKLLLRLKLDLYAADNEAFNYEGCGIITLPGRPQRRIQRLLLQTLMLRDHRDLERIYETLSEQDRQSLSFNAAFLHSPDSAESAKLGGSDGSEGVGVSETASLLVGGSNNVDIDALKTRVLELARGQSQITLPVASMLMMRVAPNNIGSDMWLDKVYLDIDVIRPEGSEALGGDVEASLAPAEQDVQVCLYQQITDNNSGTSSSGAAGTQDGNEDDLVFRLLEVSESRRIIWKANRERAWTSFRFPWVHRIRLSNDSGGGDGGGAVPLRSTYWVGVYSTQSTAPRSQGIIRLWGDAQSNEIVNGRSKNFDNAFAFAYQDRVASSAGGMGPTSTVGSGGAVGGENAGVGSAQRDIPSLFRWKVPTSAALASAQAASVAGMGRNERLGQGFGATRSSTTAASTVSSMSRADDASLVVADELNAGSKPVLEGAESSVVAAAEAASAVTTGGDGGSGAGSNDANKLRAPEMHGDGHAIGPNDGVEQTTSQVGRSAGEVRAVNANVMRAQSLDTLPLPRNTPHFVNPLLSTNPSVVAFHTTFNRRVYKLLKHNIGLRQDANSIEAALLGR